MPPISAMQYSEMLARTQRNAKREAPPVGEPVKREEDLHNQIIAVCRARGWPYIHSRFDKASRIAVGAPDFIVFADQGRVFPMEIKTKIGKLTTEQLGWQLMLGKCGHKYFVVRSIEQFLEIANGEV